jgi:hypothetical protein
MVVASQLNVPPSHRCFIGNANAGELGKAFLAVFNMLKLVAPHLIDQLRNDARAGGFARIRQRIVAVVRESKDEQTTDHRELPALPPGRLSRNDWLEITRRFPTQRAAVDETGYDPKTIEKYLRKHRIPHPWKHGKRRPSDRRRRA